MSRLVVKKNYQILILHELETIRKGCIANQDQWRGRAYSKAMESIKDLDKIHSLEDIKGLEFIGKSIQEKIKDIITNGFSKHARAIEHDPNITFINEVIKINGIGPAKAMKLIESGVNSIQLLQTRHDLLSSKQILGFRHYIQFSKKIPRDEMDKHNEFLKIMSDNRIIIAGSYRRGKCESGDIDVLFRSEKDLPQGRVPSDFKEFIELLKHKNYIIDDISYGPIKYMGYCKIDNYTRRIDIMYCSRNTYPFALMYFTGSADFNTHMRSIFSQKKLRLNEHGIFTRDGIKISLDGFNEENDIFKLLKLPYIKPQYRSKDTLQKLLKRKKPKFLIIRK